MIDILYKLMYQNTRKDVGIVYMGYEQYLVWGLKCVNTLDDRNPAWLYRPQL